MKVTRARAPMPKVFSLDEIKPGEVVRFVNGDVLYIVGDVINSTTISINTLPGYPRVGIMNIETGAISAPLADTKVVRVKLECKHIGDA